MFFIDFDFWVLSFGLWSWDCKDRDPPLLRCYRSVSTNEQKQQQQQQQCQIAKIWFDFLLLALTFGLLAHLHLSPSNFQKFIFDFLSISCPGGKTYPGWRSTRVAADSFKWFVAFAHIHWFRHEWANRYHRLQKSKVKSPSPAEQLTSPLLFPQPPPPALWLWQTS